MADALWVAIVGAESTGKTTLAAALAERLARDRTLDLPWVPDGLQRDGPHVRMPVDDVLRELMGQHGIPYAVVGGQGAQRLDNALAALAPLLAPRAPSGDGLFTRLDPKRAQARAWACECCNPEAERALLRRR